MSCNTMRDLEYERDVERENERRRKKLRKEEEERARKLKEKNRLELEKKRREKAIATIKDQARRLQWLVKDFPLHPGSFHLYKPGTHDIMKVDVFENGTVRVDTPGVISPQNHPSADAFMANLANILKGKWKTVKRYMGGVLGHAVGHSHDHTHAHGHTH